MAIFRLQITSISRGAGRSVVAAAAYRAGEQIRDERSGALHNHSRRNDVPHKEIMLPTGLDAAAIPWVRQRSDLWNAAERVERRRDARVGREFQIALPHELSADQRRELARAFSQELADRYRVVVDLAVHEPRPAGDQRNHHAHLLLTSREITANGFGAKAGLDLNGQERKRLGLLAGIPEMRAVRERWAALANEALQIAGLEARIDHRSLQKQGIERLPRPQFPYGVFQQERRGEHSEVAQRIRANHLERVQARHMRAIAQESSQPSPLQHALQPPDIDDVRKQAVQAWLQMRSEAIKPVERAARNEKITSSTVERASPEDDLAL